MVLWWSGKLLAHGISLAGSDWVTVYVKVVDSGENLSDEVKWVKFSSISWLHDDSGY